jgi:hypothetical protein
MSATSRKILRWTPRILGVVYAAFISLFALDVWGTAGGFWEKLAGFLIHLMPTYVVVIALVVAWKWPWIGSIAFMGLAVAFSFVFGWREVGVLLPMALPLIVIGLLFLADGWANRPQLRPKI